MPTYKKVGGIHFIKIGRVGFNFYLSKPARRVVKKSHTQKLSKPALLGMAYLVNVCSP